LPEDIKPTHGVSGNPGSVSGRFSKWQIGAVVFVVIAYLALWSPWYYPTSDSSVYVVLARNLLEGRGYTYMGAPHRMVSPAMPGLLAGLMSVTRSFAPINAMMTGLTLASLFLSYAAMRHWVGRQMALIVVVVSALCYWHFRMATVIMTDQLFLCLFWAAMLCLARWDQAKPAGRSRGWLILAIVFLSLGFCVRTAGILIIPGIIVVIWLRALARSHRIAQSFVVAAVAGIPMVLLGIGYLAWSTRSGPAPRESFSLSDARAYSGTLPQKSKRNLQIDGKASKAGPAKRRKAWHRTQYSPWRPEKIKHFKLLLFSPARFVCEPLIAPSRFIFERREMSLGLAIAIIINLLLAAGVYRLIREHRWWLLTTLPYCVYIWYRFAGRIKPRYMLPVLPILLIWLIAGLDQMTVIARPVIRDKNKLSLWSKRLGALLLAGIVASNLPILVMEIFYRHQRDFYQATRLGAYAELVDAAAHIRRQFPPDAMIYTNDEPNRRIIHLLTGRRMAIHPVGLKSPREIGTIRRFFEKTAAKYAVLKFAQGRNWPQWHIRTDARSVTCDLPWYALYIWDSTDGKPVRVKLRKDRQWLQSVPSSEI